MRLAPICLLVGVACAPYVPPKAPTPRTATPVAASFDRTWNAVIDVFASRVITIETMERASGFIVASTAGIPGYSKADSATALSYADCGKPAGSAFSAPHGPYLPSSAKYNVLVRAAGEGAIVQVTAKFIRADRSSSAECSSHGAFEQAFESAVKTRAEAP